MCVRLHRGGTTRGWGLVGTILAASVLCYPAKVSDSTSRRKTASDEQTLQFPIFYTVQPKTYVPFHHHTTAGHIPSPQ